MKTYCFNYSIEGVATFLPVFICSEGMSQYSAWQTAKNYLEYRNPGWPVTVYFKNYPDMTGKEFQTQVVKKYLSLK